jgi:hypothetical protein
MTNTATTVSNTNTNTANIAVPTNVNVDSKSADINTTNTNPKDINSKNAKNTKRQDIDIKKLTAMSIGEKISVSAFKCRGKTCLCEFGGQRSGGGTVCFVTRRDYSMKVGYCLKNSRPRGKAAAIPVDRGDKMILIREQRGNINLFYTYVFDVVSSQNSDYVTLKMTHKYIGKKVSQTLPDKLIERAFDKLDDNGLRVLYAKYFHLIDMPELLDKAHFDEMNSIEKFKALQNEHQLAKFLIKHWPAMAIVRFDPIDEKVYHHVYKVDFQSKELVQHLLSFRTSLNDGTFNNEYRQHIFNASSVKSFKNVWEKVSKTFEIEIPPVPSENNDNAAPSTIEYRYVIQTLT